MKKILISFLVIVLLIIAACSNEEKITNQNKDEQNTEDENPSQIQNTNAQVIISPAKNETNTTKNTTETSENNLQITQEPKESDLNTTPEETKPKGITLEELSTHNTKTDCWVGYMGGVYDLTKYLPLHPGGVDPILRRCGTSAEFEKAFSRQHGTTKVALLKMMGTYKGDLI